MKILHICLAAFYIDNFSYQENMLPKYHKRLGYDVSILASLQTFDKNGNADYFDNGSEYTNEYDIKVKRINYAKGIKSIVRTLKIYNNLYDEIDKESPDIIFIHGCQFFNMNEVVRYVKDNPSIKVFVDNHCDFSNSATNWISKNILHRILWRHSAQIIEPYVERFYGVLPARVDFLIKMYNLPQDKVKLLVMGADDDKVREALEPKVRSEIRQRYGIKDNEFLIVTGGKIDSAKKQVILLINAIKKIKRDDVKLIVFGSVTEELKNKLESLVDDELIKYIGWIDSNECYKYFAASDLVVFPGRHSVLWEQAVGTGIPIVVKKWDGTDHIDLDGNCRFLYEDSSKEIAQVLLDIIENNQKYREMKQIAKERAMKEFSYINISKISIE